MQNRAGFQESMCNQVKSITTQPITELSNGSRKPKEINIPLTLTDTTLLTELSQPQKVCHCTSHWTRQDTQHT